MSDIDTNLFGEKPVETDAAEIEKAKKEIASKGSVLLTVAPQMPSPEDIGRSRSLANRAMREAESLVVKDLESYKTGCDLSRVRPGDQGYREAGGRIEDGGGTAPEGQRAFPP